MIIASFPGLGMRLASNELDHNAAKEYTKKTKAFYDMLAIM